MKRREHRLGGGIVSSAAPDAERSIQIVSLIFGLGLLFQSHKAIVQASCEYQRLCKVSKYI
jgi:Na+/phosphate symporter